MRLVVEIFRKFALKGIPKILVSKTVRYPKNVELAMKFVLKTGRYSKNVEFCESIH